MIRKLFDMKTIAKTMFGLLMIAASINISAQNKNNLKDIIKNNSLIISY